MKLSTGLSLLALAGSTLARSVAHIERDLTERHLLLPRQESVNHTSAKNHTAAPKILANAGGTIIKQTKKVKPYIVNSTGIPDVDFDIGEAYAGLMPISKAENAPEFYFFFQPSANPLAGDEILIWLNGGPGCSSLEGLLQENGPFLWQYGTFKPVKNPWTWSKLTNVVWVEQPVGTGFGTGTPTATSAEDIAQQFLGFWRNFIQTFGLQDRKVFIAGESFAGQMVPYIADAMLKRPNKRLFNLDSIMVYDPTLTYNVLQADLVTAAYVRHFQNTFNLNETFMNSINQRSLDCGYDAYQEQWLGDAAFPPPGPMPLPPNVNYDNPECAIWGDVFGAALLVNPSFDCYQILTTPPNLWDVLGWPGSYPYLPSGTEVYFNRADVQKAINAPIKPWSECQGPVLIGGDASPRSALSVLPDVIEKANRVVIGHGLLDYLLIANGSLLAIQNMTWGGSQGFGTPPSQFNDFYVPYHVDASYEAVAGAGVMGKYWTERKLTYVSIDLAGHMVPQYTPTASYRQLEYLLGRIDSLGEISDFTTDPGDWGNNPPK